MQIYKIIHTLFYFIVKKIVFVLILLSALPVLSQNELSNIIDSKQDSIYAKLLETQNLKNVKEKLELSTKVVKLFEEMLELPESWDYNYDLFENLVSVLKSDDDAVKIYTWAVFFEDGTFKYYGFVQTKNVEDDEISVYFLEDKSDEIVNPTQLNLNHNEWFGALYYEIITIKNKKQNSYALLGWDGNNNFTQKKIIEVLHFKKNEKPEFGSSFTLEDKREKRVVFEYSKQVNMTLRYDTKHKMIIFDHLSPAEYKYTDIREYYGPDFSNDALYFEKGKWIHLTDVDVRNPVKKNKNKNKLIYDY